MDLLLRIFLKNILPSFLVMGAGVLLDRTLHVDNKSLVRLAIYVLAPCLIFSNIVQSTVDPSQFAAMILFVLVSTLALCALALGVGWALGWSSRMMDALVLSVAFVNAGNFGLSIIQLAFGDAGLELGTVFFVASNLTCNTLAAFFAARSNGGRMRAFQQVLRLPALYAFILAFALRSLHLAVPQPLLVSTALVGGATVPIMLLLLGLQLSQAQVGGRYREVSLGVAMRLVVGALLAFVLAPAMGLHGLARSVAITEASTPTAVNSALMAVQFDADADYVTSVIFFSTLLSSITLTVLLYILI